MSTKRSRSSTLRVGPVGDVERLSKIIAIQQEALETLSSISVPAPSSPELQPHTSRILDIAKRALDAASATLWFLISDRTVKYGEHADCHMSSRPPSEDMVLKAEAHSDSVEELPEKKVTLATPSCTDMFLSGPRICVCHWIPRAGRVKCYQQITWVGGTGRGRPSLKEKSGCPIRANDKPGTCIGIGLMTKESIIGVISLGIDRVRYLSEDDASVLDYVGTTAALVIENIEFRRFMSQESRRVADMCKEVHHRVRNDLQTVAGLVFLQLQHCDSQEAKAVLTDTTMRIRSIALVHQLLSEERSELVRVGDLAEKIMETAIRASNTGQDVPAFTVTGDDVPVGPKRATHLAIVLNELITNSLTRSPYAESIRRLRCSVGRAADDQVVLEFADDGNNFAERFDASKDSALGLQIAFDIVKEDLDGCMEVIPGAGAHVRITFKN